jgi:hypothetical protein
MTGVVGADVPLLMIVTVGVATGCVGRMIVVTGGLVVVVDVATGAGSVVKNAVVQSLWVVAVTALTLHQ